MKSREEMDPKILFKEVKNKINPQDFEKFLMIVRQLNKGLMGMQAALMHLRPLIGDELMTKFKKVVNY